jgi:hypothetical protein
MTELSFAVVPDAGLPAHLELAMRPTSFGPCEARLPCVFLLFQTARPALPRTSPKRADGTPRAARVSTAKAQRRLDVKRIVASPSKDSLGAAGGIAVASRSRPARGDSLTPEQTRERLAAFELFLLGRAGPQEDDG